METRICKICNKEKQIDCFGIIGSKHKNKIYRRYVCKECFYFNKTFYSKSALSKKKNEAKRRNLEFKLTQEDFQNLPTHCPILGIELKMGIENKLALISVDRIDNSKGYLKDNIVFISNKANRYKSDLSFEQIEKFYIFYRKLMEQRGWLPANYKELFQQRYEALSV